LVEDILGRKRSPVFGSPPGLETPVVFSDPTAIPGAPLRNAVTGKGDAPFMDSLIVIITIFYVAGDLYGRGAGTIKGSADVIGSIEKSWAGLASLIFLARLNSAEGDIGEPLTLPAIAAVLIGGTSLFGGVGTVSGTLVGALILTLVLNGMNLLAIDANWQPLVTGAILIIAVALDVLTRGRDGANR